MRTDRNPGRVAGLWYLFIILLGPLRLLYVPSKLFVSGNATATAANIAAGESLFRVSIGTSLACAVGLVMLTMALYRLFASVDRQLAALVVIFGGVMPAVLAFVGAAGDFGALLMARGADFLSVFDQAQRHALVLVFLKYGDGLNTAAEILWGVWLFPLAALVYRSRLLPRFLGIWLALNGVAWVGLSVIGILWPSSANAFYRLGQPAFVGEIVFMLWLVVKGAKPAVTPTALA